MAGPGPAWSRSPSAARNGAAAPPKAAPPKAKKRLAPAALAGGATRPAAATSTALRVACSLVLGLLPCLAPPASAQKSQQQAESAGPARVSPENGAGAGQNDPQTQSSDPRPNIASARGGPSEGGGGGGGTTERNSPSGGTVTTSSPPTPGPNLETTASADDGASSSEQPLPSPTSADGDRGESGGSNPGGGDGGTRRSRDDAGGGKTGETLPSPVLSTPPPETVVLTSVITDARGQDATTVVRRVYQPAPTLVTPSPTPVTDTAISLSADAANSHSSTTYVVFGVVGGAAVVAAIIGIWVFRKWKLKPSLRFDQKYDLPSQGTPESAAAFLRELKEP